MIIEIKSLLLRGRREDLTICFREEDVAQPEKLAQAIGDWLEKGMTLEERQGLGRVCRFLGKYLDE